MVPPAKGKPASVSHKIISAVVGLWSSPPEDAAWTKKRLGHVGPGIEACQLSQTTNSLAKAFSTANCEGEKERITRLGSPAPPPFAKAAAKPLLSIAG